MVWDLAWKLDKIFRLCPSPILAWNFACKFSWSKFISSQSKNYGEKPETWYVQVDCYFFTEDLRQFSFGRIGVLKEVWEFYLTKPCQFDWRQYQQKRDERAQTSFSPVWMLKCLPPNHSHWGEADICLHCLHSNLLGFVEW